MAGAIAPLTQSNAPPPPPTSPPPKLPPAAVALIRSDASAQRTASAGGGPDNKSGAVVINITAHSPAAQPQADGAAQRRAAAPERSVAAAVALPNAGGSIELPGAANEELDARLFESPQQTGNRGARARSLSEADEVDLGNDDALLAEDLVRGAVPSSDSKNAAGHARYSRRCSNLERLEKIHAAEREAARPSGRNVCAWVTLSLLSAGGVAVATLANSGNATFEGQRDHFDIPERELWWSALGAATLFGSALTKAVENFSAWRRN